jgi:preprotein translocase subunit YajC
MEPFILLAVVFVLMYALFILPQQRRVRAHQQLVASLREGDEVVLTAGILGHIVELRDDELTFEAGPGVRFRVARQAVLRRVEPGEAEAPAAAAAERPPVADVDLDVDEADGDEPADPPVAADRPAPETREAG